MEIRDGQLHFSPTDLNAYVGCRHLTTLSAFAARGEIAVPHVANQEAELLRLKGEEHERDFLERLRGDGATVVHIDGDRSLGFERAAASTADTMRAGPDVIYQATFVHGSWRGRADFLLKVPGATRLGSWGYEALDAKLARAEKPSYALQLCFYSDGVASIQGATPEHMRVLLGGGSQTILRYDDFAAYYRRARARFEDAVATRVATEPYPVEHCGLCNFRQVCAARWDAEDHLVQVADVRRAQVTRLREGGIRTFTALARAPADTSVPHIAPHAFEKLRDQAALQMLSRDSGDLKWHKLVADSGCGFDLLPQPSSGDIVFDIEGDPFWEPARGLHFLFGVLLRSGDDWTYEPFWAHEREGERRMFESFVDLVQRRLAQDPQMHVYHYGTYEKAALTQLMGSYATREDAVDDLLWRKIFVNLHTVVRQGIRAGVPSYSLKEVEALVPFARRADVRSGLQAVLAYERWMHSGDTAALSSIAGYNEEDCRATLALREWLVQNRPADSSWALAVEAEARDDPEAGDREALRVALIDGAEAGSPPWLAGELLEYHRREARPGWWWFFERRDQMSGGELTDDSEAIGGLAQVGESVSDKQSLIYTLSFPPQQHKLGAGTQVTDPAAKKGAGTLVSVNDEAGTLALKRGRSFAGVALPRSLIPNGPIGNPEHRAALLRFAKSLLKMDGTYRALSDILARSVPRIRGRSRGSDIQTTDLATQRQLTLDLEESYLFIQGPPGTGKTWTGARLITELMRRGRRVGVAANSHKAIHNLLKEIEAAAAEEGLLFRGFKKATTSEESRYDTPAISSETEIAAFASASDDTLLFAGTAWLFAHGDLGDGAVDTLFIDEAGQVSLADALAMGTAARNVVLLGDPLQLAQVSQGIHPEGTELSVLEHLLGEHATVPPSMGLFLERTWRMHPDVCRFVSEVVYESRLKGVPELARQSTAFGEGLRFIPVDHIGNASSSTEEADAVAVEITRMIGGSWTDRDGAVGTLDQQHFMVVAPYNAHVRCLRAALRRVELDRVQVGTVDKFQGREAPIVLYSMATSSLEEIPRSAEFLFSRNRLNVAISRAMCLATVVASPRLLESDARTIDQMRLINALCRFVEMAEEQRALRAVVRA